LRSHAGSTGGGAPGSRAAPPVTSRGDRLACLVAAIGPCGFFPVAPASFASLVLAAGYVLLPPWGAVADGVTIAAVTPLAIWAAGRAERIWGHDARRIVVDEGAGMAMTLFALPPGPLVALAAFFAFRVFDVLKPFPGRRAEGLPGGYGVVMDDLVAGIYANLTVRLAWRALTAIGWTIG
jgi:phosphatidylglycerophosphatase A